MALNKKFSASDGLSFSTTPTVSGSQVSEPATPTGESTPKPRPKQKPKQQPKKPMQNTRFEKSTFKKKETKSIRKQLLIKETDNKRIEEECKRLEISQNQFINMLTERYFE